MQFELISAVNVARAGRWHPGGVTDWNVTDWTCAMAGEAGEVCNAIKKLTRAREKLVQALGPQTVEEAVRQVGLELGDTYLYLNLLAVRWGVTLQACVDKVYEPPKVATLRILHPATLACQLMEDVGHACMDASLESIEPANQDYMMTHLGFIFCSLEHIAVNLGLDLETCVVETFNRVSEREGFPERLDLMELRAAA